MLGLDSSQVWQIAITILGSGGISSLILAFHNSREKKKDNLYQEKLKVYLDLLDSIFRLDKAINHQKNLSRSVLPASSQISFELEEEKTETNRNDACSDLRLNMLKVRILISDNSYGIVKNYCKYIGKPSSNDKIREYNVFLHTLKKDLKKEKNSHLFFPF